MGWDVNADMGGHVVHGLCGSNIKTGKYLPSSYREGFLNLLWVQMVQHFVELINLSYLSK